MILAALVVAVVFGEANVFAPFPADGMALATEGTLLYTGAGDMVSAYETREDPFRPRLLGQMKVPHAAVRQLAVQDGVVYLSAREAQLQILDFRHPERPAFLTRYDCNELATGVDVAGDVCFIGLRNSGVEFVDVRDPRRPQHIAQRKTDESQSVLYRDGSLYSGEWGTGSVTVFDCRDMANLMCTSLVELHGFGDGLWIGGDRLYASTGHHSKHRPVAGLPTFVPPDLTTYHGKTEGAGAGNGLDVFSLEDPAHPKWLSRIDFPPFYSRGNDFWTPRLSGDGRMLFSAHSHNGVFAVDVSDAKNPRLLDRFVFPGETKTFGAASKAIGSIAVGEGVLYVACRDVGVAAVRVVGAKRQVRERGVLPRNASFREAYPNDDVRFHRWLPPVRGHVHGAAVTDEAAFVAAGDAGLYRVGYGRATGFGPARRLNGSRPCYDVALCASTLVAAEGLHGWGVYATQGDGSVREVVRLRRTAGGMGYGYWTRALTDGLVAISPRTGSFDVYDVSHPEKPRLVKSLPQGCPGWDRFLGGVVGGRWLVWSQLHTRTRWYDLAQGADGQALDGPPSTRLLMYDGICPFGDKALFSAKGYAFIEPGSVRDLRTADGAWLFDHAYPDAEARGKPWSDGRYVLLTNRFSRRAWFYDLRDPSAPKAVWKARLSGNPDFGAVRNGVAFIACGYQGFLMAKDVAEKAQ